MLQLKAAGRLGYFDLLSEKERACARHALFLNSDSGARRAVIDVLGSRRKASVNGTQAWFVRSIFSKAVSYTHLSVQIASFFAHGNEAMKAGETSEQAYAKAQSNLKELKQRCV